MTWEKFEILVFSGALILSGLAIMWFTSVGIYATFRGCQ